MSCDEQYTHYNSFIVIGIFLWIITCILFLISYYSNNNHKKDFNTAGTLIGSFGTLLLGTGLFFKYIIGCKDD